MSSRSHPVSRTLRLRRALAALALLTTAAVPLVVSTSPPAKAAGIGVGWDYDANSHLGAYTVAGGNAYCLNPGVPPATAATTDAGLAGAFTSFGPKAGQNVVALSPETIGRVNYLVTTYGQTSDRDVAAAVAMAVATVANPAAYAAHTAPWGDNYYVHYMPAADFTRVKALASRFRAEAAAFSPAPAGAAALHLSTSLDNSLGALTVTSLDSESVSATITLTNGRFVAGGSAEFTGTVRAGMSLPITAIAPSGATHFRVSAHADLVGGGGPAARLHLWATPGRQTLATPGGSAASTFSASAEDAEDRSTLFAPALSTRVTSEQVVRGAASTDTVTFASTVFTDPVSAQPVANPWAATDGTPLTVSAHGTWYGPSLTPLAESATVPEGTPVAAHATIVATGPGSYTATGDAPAPATGYYTWVWTIDIADQAASTAARLPAHYRFADSFGLGSESQVAPTEMRFATQLDSPVATICDSVTDVITPAISTAGWVQQSGGAAVPVTLTGRVYRTDVRPGRSAVVPDDAQLIGTVSAVLTGPSPTTSPAFGVGCVAGFTTVRWSVETSAQPPQYRTLVQPWADDFGVPSETVQVVAPTITTQAGATGPGGAVRDVATVSGAVPSAGLDLTWSGYLRPADASAAVCTPATLAFTSTKPTVAAGAGDFASEDFSTPPEFVGSIDWIETARVHGTSTIVHTGVCGEAGETSVSALPTVATTPPVGIVAAGSRARDTFIVSGWVPEGMSVVARLYRQEPGARRLECTPRAQVGEASAPVSLASGTAIEAHYRSPETESLPAGDYGFVEQLIASNGAVLAEGRCEGERFTVAATLASTGASGLSPLAPIGAGALSLGLFGLSFGLRRRARS